MSSQKNSRKYKKLSVHSNINVEFIEEFKKVQNLSVNSNMNTNIKRKLIPNE